MKQIITLLVALTMSVFSFGQKQAVDTPKHDPFVFVGAGWTPNKDMTYSAEFGTWGGSSPTSFSITYDMSRNVGKGVDNTNPLFSHWLGAKAYYTVYSREKICYMLYAKEAVQLEGSSNTLLEVGFNPNYTLTDNWLFGITVGNQALQGSEWNWFTSAGFVYLFKRHPNQ